MDCIRIVSALIKKKWTSQNFTVNHSPHFFLASVYHVAVYGTSKNKRTVILQKLLKC